MLYSVNIHVCTPFCIQPIYIYVYPVVQHRLCVRVALNIRVATLIWCSNKAAKLQMQQ